MSHQASRFALEVSNQFASMFPVDILERYGVEECIGSLVFELGRFSKVWYAR